MKAKLYNNVKQTTETFELVKPSIGTLPYGLAYRKFLLSNGFSLNQSYHNNGILSSCFDRLYSF